MYGFGGEKLLAQLIVLNETSQGLDDSQRAASKFVAGSIVLLALGRRRSFQNLPLDGRTGMVL
jgi:hypothetical protein